MLSCYKVAVTVTPLPLKFRISIGRSHLKFARKIHNQMQKNSNKIAQAMFWENFRPNRVISFKHSNEHSSFSQLLLTGNRTQQITGRGPLRINICVYACQANLFYSKYIGATPVTDCKALLVWYTCISWKLSTKWASHETLEKLRDRLRSTLW